MPMVTYGSRQASNDTQKKKHTHKCEYTAEEASTQTHVHEFEGSTQIVAENGEEAHNHRFAGVTSEVIFVPGGHKHTFLVNSDFFDHHHEVGGTTELQTPVGGGKHVHFATDTTTFDDFHDHDFQFATLIESPLV